jgi:membrane associated rhomboid family serine protease
MENFSLTLIIVIMTGIVSYQAFERPAMRSRMLFVPDLINRFGQYDRFLTHGFIHADWMHLLMNLFVLYMFGQNAEYYFQAAFGAVLGPILYLVLYLGGIVFSSIPSFIKHRENRFYSALGASGAVSSVVFLNIFFAPWSMIYIYAIIPMPIVLGGVLYLWYSDYMGKKGNDNIGHDAHFYGAIWGFAFTFVMALILRPELVTRFVDLLTHPTFD